MSIPELDYDILDIDYDDFPKDLMDLDLNMCRVDETELLKFTKLKSLDISYCGLYEIPKIPENVEILVITGNFIKIIKNLPKGLKELYVENNMVETIEQFPESIEILNLDSNKIKNITIPKNVKDLSLVGNRISQLDLSECKQLERLNINANHLTHIGNNLKHDSGYLLLPDNLKCFKCSSNRIKYVGDMPITLEYFICDNNEIEALEILPKLKNLELLNCSNNLINKLYGFSSTLISLYCQNNKITHLDDLPSNLLYLNILGNKIRADFTLPTRLAMLNNKYVTYGSNGYEENKNIQ